MEEFDGKLILKESLTQVFSCEYYKIFKNTYFDENLRTTVSAVPTFLLLIFLLGCLFLLLIQ